MIFQIDPQTLIGLASLVTTIAAAIVSVVVAVRQTTTNRVVRRVEHQTNSLSEAAQLRAHAQGAAEEKLRQAAQVIDRAATTSTVENHP